MRIDRMVSLLLWGPQRWLATHQSRPSLPVLMYHSISDEHQHTAPYFQTVTHPNVFGEHMHVLRNEGYVGVTLSDGLRWLETSCKTAGARPVVITFDDGFHDYLKEAVPVLQRHGFKATMYLPTGYIGNLRQCFNNRECLTWNEVVDLHVAGFEFGSHTVTHPHLVRLGWGEIRTELVKSKKAIEERLQCPITSFAYPYAFPQERADFVARFTRMLKDVGYRTCVTTKIGRIRHGEDWLCLRRLPVNSCDDHILLEAKLDGAYDWLASAQGWAKAFKRCIRCSRANAVAG